MLRFKSRWVRKSQEQAAEEAARPMAEKSPAKRSWTHLLKPSRRRKSLPSSPDHSGVPRQDADKASSDPRFDSIDPFAVQEEPTAAAAISGARSPKEHVELEEIRRLFEGAPQFSASSSSSLDGDLVVLTTLPWRSHEDFLHITDFEYPSHPAFEDSSLRARLASSDYVAEQSTSYDLGIEEVPSMLSASGAEPGTVGIEHFLQEPFADALNIRPIESAPDEVVDNFNNFVLLESQPEKLGIRPIDMAAVAQRLVELTDIYKSVADDGRAGVALHHERSNESYTLLFSKFLTPPKFDSSLSEPTGIGVQVEALLRILNLKRVWYDFSNVEWRIRIGQLLFTESGIETNDDNLSNPEDGLSERDVVLLQLLLACELHLRLDPIARFPADTANSDNRESTDDIQRVLPSTSRKTRWDLVLARRFLENVDAQISTKSKLVQQESTKTLAQSIFRLNPGQSTIRADEPDVALLPRYQARQLNGLLHFATVMAWPDRSSLDQNMAAALDRNSRDFGLPSPSIYMTPLSTPGNLTPRSFRGESESSYFGSFDDQLCTARPLSIQLQAPSLFRRGSTESHPGETDAPSGGWLTRSYLAGLVMPGEAISHLLITTLLENDAEAVAALGDNANLYGGFVYKGRSFWSKSCIVGRVLACLGDSTECMGWISSSVLPDGYGDGWVDVRSDALTQPTSETWKNLAGNTAPTGVTQNQLVTNGDLLFPEESPACRLVMHLEGLRLETPTPTGLDSGETSTLALLTFVSGDIDREMHPIVLRNLSQFVSAHPCVLPLASGSNMAVHPLHTSYRYDSATALDLLDGDFNLAEGTITVVDARCDETLELLARSWSSNKGENALIARVSRTCLSCAVREANGLAIKVVIRVGEP